MWIWHDLWRNFAGNEVKFLTLRIPQNVYGLWTPWMLKKLFIHSPEVQSHWKLHGMRERVQVNINPRIAIPSSLLPLTPCESVKFSNTARANTASRKLCWCHFLFSCINNFLPAPEQTAQEFIEILKNPYLSEISPFFAPSKFIQTLCHAHVGSWVHGMHCYTPNQT